MTKPESCRGESIDDSWIYGRIIAVPIAVFLGQQAELLHHFFTQNDRQELVVRDVLDDGDVDATRLLEQSFVVPVRVDLRELGGQSVVLARHQRVHAREYKLLVHANLSRLEAEHAFVGSGAALVGVVELQREKILQTILREHRVHSQKSAEAGSQLSRELLVDTVNRIAVDDRGQRVELSARSQFAAGARRWEGANEVDALDIEQAIEVVVVGNSNLITVRMLQV